MLNMKLLSARRFFQRHLAEYDMKPTLKVLSTIQFLLCIHNKLCAPIDPTHVAAYHTEAVLRYLVPKKLWEDTFEPGLSDMRLEFNESVVTKDYYNARKETVFYHFKLLYLIPFASLASVFKMKRRKSD